MEFELLRTIEYKLTESIGVEFDAVLSGRITTDGRREFYFYASHADGFESKVARALGEFRGYEFDCGTQEDHAWKQYMEVLYPSDGNLQRMKNRSVFDVLKQKGDTLKTPRDIFHWIYFRTKMDRNAFWAAVQPLEYRLRSEPDTESGDFPFGLCIVRFQSAEEEEVDVAVVELFRRAQEFNGDYDGWETEVIPK